MILAILGPQGSGKGTQANLLANEFNMTHVGMGDILREEVHKHGELSGIIRDCMKKGKLIPDELNNKIVKNVIEKYEKNIILDGFPRNLNQAKFLKTNAALEAIIIINLSEKESIRRISSRLICTGNHKVYTEGQISEEDVIECENSGGRIIRREDDTPENVKKRLEIYHKETVPAINYLKNEKVKVIEVEGDRPISRVFDELSKKIRYLK